MMKIDLGDFDHHLYLDIRRYVNNISFYKFATIIQESEFLELEGIKFDFIGEII